MMQCLNRIEENKHIEAKLYRISMMQAMRLREEHKNFTLSFLIQSIIVSSLCGKVFEGVLNKTINNVKEYKDNLKEINNEIQFNNEHCRKFMEQLNALYERYNQVDSKDAVLSIEFAAYFFRSLSTFLLKKLNTNKKLALEEYNERIPLLESCVQLKNTFMMSSIMMVAINYLEARVKAHCKDFTECNVVPLRYKDLHAVSSYNHIGQS